jgi:PAS domain S-box-containing protein
MSTHQRLQGNSPLVQWLLLALALLVLGGVIGLDLYSEHKTIDAREREQLAAQARVVDENLSRELHATNLVLDSIRSDLPGLKAQRDGKDQIIHRLQAMAQAMPEMRTLIILDAAGTVAASNREGLIGQNYREREYFKIARHSNDPAILHVAQPFTTGLGVFAIAFVKVIRDERGAFDGVVTATVDPDYFSILLGSVRYAPDMWVSLAHGDGKLFLMVPPRPGAEGTDLNKPGSFRNRHLASGEKASVMTGVVQATGEERMLAQRVIKPANVPMDKALAVAAARDLASIFGVWREEAMVRGSLFGVLTLVSTLGLYFSQRRQSIYDRHAAAQEAERRRVEGELRLTRFSVEAASDAIFWITPDARIVDVNRAACRSLGYSREELLRLGVADVDPHYDVQAWPQHFAELRQRGSMTFESEQRTKEGSLLPVEIVANYIHLDDIELNCAFVRDVTARKQAEAEILRSNAELEQFSYSISHDMRQPLRMISSYLQLLDISLAETLDAERRGYLNFAADGAKRLDRMLVALLEYSRVGRMGEPPVWAESRGILEEALLFLQPAIAEAAADVRVEGDWPRVFVSRDEILRLLQNLIGNALKFRVTGRAPVIEVKSATDGKAWRVSVRDNGTGVAPDQLGRLFQVFQRLHSRATYEGTGIGLALCRKIAEHHGGRIRAESPGEDRGSTFCVELPLESRSSEPPTPPAVPD